ncbi:MAG: hypothetical protein WCS17_13255 [Prevotella sp.]|uniref:Uncharacterized protein n=1 Tax=Segatella cerevisiae TaxID=2053716 RepID=A0ABT1BVE6_9BACT|nr:hypothetical protein [Segatella cerevisiae]MCH3993578.1 hypothetical protein [Prevotella sp.]MCO6025073.1 hypothetical protein [Segatella cerevisiae]
MAWKRKYRCSKCGYEADTYEGKGFLGQEIDMVSCPDCHTLQPLVVGGIIGDAAPSFNSLVGRLCLNCGSARIKKWDGHTCPKCGGEMLKVGKRQYWT